MIRLPSRIHIGRLAVAFIASIVVVGLVESMLAGDSGSVFGTNNDAKNLARMICGAQIECVNPNGAMTRASQRMIQDPATAALIMEDQTVSRSLGNGETIFIVTLPRISVLNRFAFLNENAAARGQVQVSVSNYRLSPKSSQWNEVSPGVSFNGKRIVDLFIPGVEAKYVRLSFRVEKEGRIAAIGLYGSETLERFGVQQAQIIEAKGGFRSVRLKDSINFNFANLYAKARIVYVSSGDLPRARRMIDDDTATTFRFSPNDPHPTVIVELAGSEQLHRASTIYKMQPGRLDVYLLNEFPSDPKNLGHLTPIASVKDAAANGKAAADFEVQDARYVALRWTPDDQTSIGDGFEVAEIGAFGGVPLSLLQVSDAPVLYADNLDTAVTVPPNPPVLPVVTP